MDLFQHKVYMKCWNSVFRHLDTNSGNVQTEHFNCKVCVCEIFTEQALKLCCEANKQLTKEKFESEFRRFNFRSRFSSFLEDTCWKIIILKSKIRPVLNVELHMSRVHLARTKDDEKFYLVFFCF